MNARSGSEGLFAPIELAARIDHAESRLSAEVGRAAVARREGAFVREIAGGVAVFASLSSPVNKMIGVGFDGSPAEDALEAVEGLFRARGAPLQAEVSTLADPAFAAALTRRRYALQGFENVLGRRLDPSDAQPPEGPSGFDVRLLEPRDLDAWLEVTLAGFLSPDRQGVPAEALPPRETLEDVMRDFSHAPGFRRYAAWVGDRMAGGASLRLDDGVAQLCGAATLPEFRRRGIQTAFLRRRLADAVGAGCDLAVVVTQPGSKSQQNSQEQGFSLLYSRALLVRAPE